MMLIIAFTAEKESGKTTAAKELRTHLENRGYRVRFVGFSIPVKEAALDLGWNGEKDAKGRRLLQLIGKEVMRDCIDPDYLVRKMETQIERAAEAAIDICIIDDLRFLNEYGYLRAERAFICKITRRKSLWALVKSFFIPKHGSEAGIPIQLCDYHLRNDGTLEQLLTQVTHCVVPAIFTHQRKNLNGQVTNESV
jgi:hypothetical protein